MCQVNNERERNILEEEEDQIGREPIRWRRRRKENEKKKRESLFMGNRKGKKRKEKKNLRSFVFRRSEVNGLRIKVVLLNESYE